MIHNADTAHTSHPAKNCAFCLCHVRKLNDVEKKKKKTFVTGNKYPWMPALDQTATQKSG